MDSPLTFCVACVIIYALNCGLGVVRPEMTMDFVEPMIGERAAHGQPTAWMWECQKQSQIAC